MTTILTRSRQETVELGKAIGATLKPGDVAALSGNLGTGKTTLVTGICEALGVRTHVASPTFTMVNEYDARGVTIVHIDLYRVRSGEEAAGLGLEEYFDERYICLIEWPEYIRDILPACGVEVQLEYGDGEEERRISIQERLSGREMRGPKLTNPLATKGGWRQ